MHHVSHHILPSSLPPRDSNWWICDIIKHPLYHNCIHHSVTLLPLLSLSIHSPPSVQSSQSPHTIPYVLKCKVAAIKGISKCYLSSPPPHLPSPHNPPSTHPPHANTSTAIQDGRIMNCSWRLRGARETKGFLLSCIPLLPPFCSLITYYDVPFPSYLNTLWIDQQRSKQKLAVLQVLLACCQQLDGTLLNDNNVYPLPSCFFIFFIFFFFLSTLSRPLTHLAHAQVMRSGSARGGRKHLDHTQEGHPFDAMNRHWWSQGWCLRIAEPYAQQGLAAVACRKGTNERKGEEGVQKKKKEREREREKRERETKLW